LNFRPVWEQPGGAALSTQPAGQAVQIPRASFGQQLPAAVQTARIVFVSNGGGSCCIAVNPTLLPIDPTTGRGFLVLDQLPIGPATLTLAGFATDFAPAQAGVTNLCPTDPAGTGAACDAVRLATPSFESNPTAVTIAEGTETNAGDIPVFSLPFLLNFTPDSGSTVANPVSVAFTVVDAVNGINRQSIALNVSQNGVPVGGLNTVNACSDASAAPCSAGGTLGVTGFKVTGQAQTLNLGSAQVRIQASNLAPTPRALDFSYQFQVGSVSPGPTPTGPTPTPNGTPQVVIVEPPASIADAAKKIPAGSTIIVAPGVYGPIEIGQGDLPGSLTLVADVTGQLTASAPAPVFINQRGQSPGIQITGQGGILIDGFTVRGAGAAGVLLTNSPGSIVRNCTVTGVRGDGVRVESSGGTLVFDNLIYTNSGAGIRVTGSSGVSIINNTVYGNTSGGIVLGNSGSPSSDVVLRNNIVSTNTPTGIAVVASTSGYDGDYDLNNDGYDGVSEGPHDIAGSIADANPLFVAPNAGDFHLGQGVAGSTSPAIDAGDPATDSDLIDALTQRSTQTDGTLDVVPVDLGYHYPGPNPPSIPTPTS
jgi:parallel beta-helix repeat protein